MINNTPSRTAESAAAGRAAHFLYESPVIFEDPYALSLTSPLWRMIIRNRILYRLIFTKQSGFLRSVGAQVLARSRYAEDLLLNAVKNGATQYVMIGAGLDSFALRREDLSHCLTVYELDHPVTQGAKRERLRNLGYELPENVEFIPIDCERESVEDVLAASSFSPNDRTFFSCLGTTYYLTRDAVLKTLRSIGTYTVLGSEIVFDYGLPERLLDRTNRIIWRTIERAGYHCGEPILSCFAPDELEQTLSDLGFDLREHLSPGDQKRRYFSTHDPTPLASYFAHAHITQQEVYS